MTIVVCNACGEPWERYGSPAICPKCGVSSFGIAVERGVVIQPANKEETEQEKNNNRSSTGEGETKMEIEEVLKKLISNCVHKKDWVKLDALNQWAEGIDDFSIEGNLKPRYPEVKAFPERYNRLLSELKIELKALGIEYPSFQLEPSKINASIYIQNEIEKQCGEYIREDMKRRIQEASEAERKLLYLYAIYCPPLYSKNSSPLQEKEVSSTDLSQEVWKGLFEASFGPILGGNVLDILRWFNVCNYYTWTTKQFYGYGYKVPKYASPIMDNISNFLEIPKLTDAEAYIRGVISESDIPRLAFLEIALGYLKPNNYTYSDFTRSLGDIKSAFELLYPSMFGKYSESAVGIIAKSENTLYICPFNKDKILGEILETKKDMVASLVPIFDKVKKALGRDGAIDFQKDNLAAYGGYINLGGRTTLYVLLSPWITPPQQRQSKDYLQQLPWVYRNTPCLILTTDVFRSDFIKTIQKEGPKDICIASFEEKANTIDIYLFGNKAEPFNEVIPILQSLGYKVTDQTKAFREEWFPLKLEAVIDFTHNKFTVAELEANRKIEFQSGRIKDDRIRATIEKYGLSDFARRIGYPSFSYDDTSAKKVANVAEAEPVTVGQPQAKPKILQPIPSVPPKPAPQIKPTLGSETILLGTKDATKQWGVIGRCKDKIVKLDLNAPHIITVFGKMGSGKGYTIGVICEMLCSPSILNISEVGKRATVLVLYKPKEDVRSEFWSVTSSNDVPEEIKGLATYGTGPTQVVPPENLRIFLDPLVYKKASSKFIKEYGTQNVYPLHLDPSNLKGDEWALVLSAGGTGEPLYVKRLFKIIENLQFETFDMATLRQSVWSDSDLTQPQKKLANQRMDILATYLEPQSGGQDFTKLLAIGGVNIFDLRGTIRTPDDDFSVMTLILSLLQSKKGFEGEPFAFVINEAHTYFRKGISQEFVEAVENLIRRKRHGANWLFLDSHDPGDLDEKVIELSDIKVLHFTDKTALKSSTLTKAFESSPKSFYELSTGEALISADYSSIGSFVPLLVSIRPRLTKHGAPTKMAIG